MLKEKKTFSLEVFPPKADKPLEPLMETLDKLYSLAPDYISCTYGAGGTNKGRSLEICGAIEQAAKASALAHITCIGNSRADILSFLSEYTAEDVENILALRGDFPAGFEGTSGDFAHADALVSFIREHDQNLCIGVAAYPETHISAPSPEADVEYLLSKERAGADFAVTQLCNSPEAMERFLESCAARGVKMPIIAGVMPVLKMDAMVRMTLSNGCSIPKKLADLCGRYGSDPDDFMKAGMDYTVYLIEEFRKLPVSGIHIYTMNRFADVAAIAKAAGLAR